MIRSHQSTTRLAVESLENRCVPAGNVTAQVVFDEQFGGSLLLIVGDNEANSIHVVEDTPGHVRIEGLESTTVNGMAAIELSSHGSEFNLAQIYLGNGDDALVHEFTHANFQHETHIGTGVGDDSVTVFVRGVVGQLLVDTGIGHDNVTIDLAPGSLLEGLHVDAGEGNDRLHFRAKAEGGLPILEETSRVNLINMGNGNDAVQFEGGFGVEHLSVHLGNGDDTLIGDPESDGPSVGLRLFGDQGHDSVLNASYFAAAMLFLFEQID
jgi:hypothetical protein